MTAPIDEFGQPCPHGGSVVTCNECLSEFMTAERLIEDPGVDQRTDNTGDAWEIDDPCPGCKQKPCICQTISLPHITQGDPFLSPWQTNPTAGTSEDAAAQLDMAGDLTFNRDDKGEAKDA